jgi:hypothetical protein
MANKTELLCLFPIYLNEPGFQPPDKGMYYLIAGNGIFLHKDTAIGSVMVQVNAIAGLVEAKNDFRLALPRIPGLVIGQALTFFRKVFEDLQSEAYLHLFFSRKLGQFRLSCPRQTVSRTKVDYDGSDQMSYEERTGRKPGEPCGEALWQLIGSIHSHCDLPAFHSATDIMDEAGFAGIHITLGNVDMPHFSMVMSLAMNWHRLSLDPKYCCLGIERIRHPTPANPLMVHDPSHRFQMALSKKDARTLCKDAKLIEKDWIPKVVEQDRAEWE